MKWYDKNTQDYILRSTRCKRCINYKRSATLPLATIIYTRLLFLYTCLWHVSKYFKTHDVTSVFVIVSSLPTFNITHIIDMTRRNMNGLEKSHGQETNLHVSLQTSCLAALLSAVYSRAFSALGKTINWAISWKTWRFVQPRKCGWHEVSGLNTNLHNRLEWYEINGLNKSWCFPQNRAINVQFDKVLTVFWLFSLPIWHGSQYSLRQPSLCV